MLESLQVYKRPASRADLSAIYDFQWQEPDGSPAGVRCAVDAAWHAYQSNLGLHSDYFRRIFPFGTLALRCLGDGTNFLRPELRIADRFYELPIRTEQD